jgi:serine/threonine-protein kinase RsbW
MIRLSVPGSLSYRDLVLRVVESGCKLVEPAPVGVQDASQGDDFEHQLVSAFGEAFNNVAIHGYRGAPPGEVRIEIEPEPGKLTLRMFDWGKSFDPTLAAATAPPALSESKMGLYIIRSFADEVRYRAGSPPNEPNVLELVKRRR